MPIDPELKALADSIDGFSGWNHADRIRLFAWFVHSVKGKDAFTTSDITACYDSFGYDKPNISQFVNDMAKRKPPVFLRRGQGFVLEGKLRAEFDAKYGEHQITLNVRQLLKDLVKQLPELGEKDIFQEALICLKHDAGRAAIIMVWNIAFYHLCQFILTHKAQEFNDRIPAVYPKRWKLADMPLVQKYDDFGDEMSERQVIEVANSAGIITGNMHRVYVEKLGKRNSAAHPSQQHVTQVQAEGFIDDLINNTILLLKI